MLIRNKRWNLKNNTILITCGTSGLGLELAKKLLELGNTVIVTGRDLAKLESGKEKFVGLRIFLCDVSNPMDISDLCTAQFPKLNILINNADEMRRISLHDNADKPDRYYSEMETNLMGPIRMVQAFLPQLKKMESAAILNVTSGWQ